ncbi:unnamed protein product, partial [Pleuronectes platessa]
LFCVVGRRVCDVTEFHLVHIIYLWTFFLFEVTDESSSYYECNCSSQWICCPSSHCDSGTVTDPEYSGRVENLCGNNKCTLRISNLRESDSAVYKFRFTTNQPTGSLTGSAAVTLSVTDLHVQVSTSVKYDSYYWAELRCQSSCRLPDHLNYVWYKNQQKMKEGATYTDYFYPANRVSCAVKGLEDFRSPSMLVWNQNGWNVSYTSTEICAFRGSTVDINCTYTYPSCYSRNRWLTTSDPTKAISQCVDNYLRMHKMESPLLLSMDLRRSPAEQDMALISFYKQPNVEWGRPLNSRLQGDTAIGQGVTRFFFSTCIEKLKSGFCIHFANANVTRLFEGEPGHLVPSASHFLVESDMFMVAGRMVGHSFLHGGPCLAGLSPAIVHVLLGGSPETATVTLEDCPDLDIRETIRLLEGESTLSEKDAGSVQELAYAWDLPSLTEKNRRWIFEKLLIHAAVNAWTGWEILPMRPSVEVVMGRYPTASTCFETLRIPGHYKDLLNLLKVTFRPVFALAKQDLALCERQDLILYEC